MVGFSQTKERGKVIPHRTTKDINMEIPQLGGKLQEWENVGMESQQDPLWKVFGKMLCNTVLPP